MKIFIDNSKTEQNVFFVCDGSTWNKFVFNEEGEGSLERSFELLLKETGKKLSDITGIAVRVGEGRFTATRIAVTFVNTLASVLNIPVAAVNSGEPEEAGRAIDNAKKGELVAAKYSAEPRVGSK